MLQKYSITQETINSRKEKAQKFLEQGKVEKAILEYNRIIFLDPECAEFYKERAQLYIKISDIGSAIANLRKSLKLTPNPETEHLLSQLFFVKGMIYINEGKVPLAMDFIEQNTQRDEQYHYLKAFGFIGVNEKVQALREIETCIKLNPLNCAEALVLKGKLLWSLGRVEEGNNSFWEAYDYKPQHKDVQEFVKIMKPKAFEWHEKAVKAIFEEDYKSAIHLINKGLQYYKDSPQLLLLSAIVNRKTENFEGALDDLERASKHMNAEKVAEQVSLQIAYTYNDIGKSLFQEGRYEEAIAPFNEALNFKDNDSGIYINRGDCYRKKGMIELAMSDYQRATKLGAKTSDLNPRIATLYCAIGIGLFNMTDYNGANFEFSRAIHYNEKEPEFYVFRAKNELARSRVSQAVSDLEKALELSPDHREANSLLASLKPNSVPVAVPNRIKVLMQKTKK